MNISEIKELLAQLGASPKRSLGQNFLLNAQVIDKIQRATLDFQPKELIEIGPGLGALTRSLKENNIPLTLLELDRRFAQYWREQGLHVVEGDALHWDWQGLKGTGRVVVVSNLPYQIAASLVMDLSCGPEAICGMVLMFQKEVAERLKARPNSSDYGLLTVVAQSFWDIEWVADAGPRDFYPAPKVVSRVLKFTRRSSEVPGAPFLRFVKVAFQQRRKLLTRNLSQLAGGLGLDWWQGQLAQLGLPETARAESLSPTQFMQLYHAYRGRVPLVERDSSGGSAVADSSLHARSEE